MANSVKHKSSKGKDVAPPTARKDIALKILGWIVVVLLVGGIYMILHNARPGKRIVCKEGVAHSLTSFGSCHEE
ncbi:MAG: hypothetical protein PHX43_06640 [Alphaproteobacteria bacterium]|nr:hypothetical protein [Alphaproteobacteria bacterium]